MVNEYQKVERENRESDLLVKARRQVPDAEHGLFRAERGGYLGP